MTDDRVLERLDHIAALLGLAHYDDIQSSIAAIRKDPVSAALLDATEEGWVRSRALQERVAGQTGAATRTIQRRLVDLVERHLMETRGSTSSTEYRARKL